MLVFCGERKTGGPRNIAVLQNKRPRDYEGLYGILPGPKRRRVKGRSVFSSSVCGYD